MKHIVNFSNIVEKNGKTIRENNLEVKHTFKLGTLVETPLEEYNTSQEGGEINLKGKAKLFIVELTRDCDGTPLYTVALHSVIPPKVFGEQIKYDALLGKVYNFSGKEFKILGKAKLLTWEDYLARLLR